MSTEGIKWFLIPDDKREEYFQFVDMFKSKVKNVDENNWNTYSDPIIKIDFSVFTNFQCLSIRLFMASIMAKDITESMQTN